MEYQRFIPEGWQENIEPFSIQELNQALKDGNIMQAKVNKCDSNYNLYIDLGDCITGVVPREEIEAINIDETGFPKPNICTSKVDKIIQFKVKDITKNNIAILSRKDVGNEAISWIKRELKEGMVVMGIVKNIRPYGAFVEIGGGIVGLVHIEDISVARIKTPYERFKIGQKINIMIKSIDKNTNRVILTYKELLRNMGRKHKRFRRGNDN